jgi:hypothetical protein
MKVLMPGRSISIEAVPISNVARTLARTDVLATADIANGMLSG